MSQLIKLKEEYQLSKCCSATLADAIVGYFSHTNILKVHRTDCGNLSKADPDRLVTLSWEQILAEPDFEPDDDYNDLDATDFAIMRHHQKMGIDYSLKVARDVGLDKQTAFNKHQHLRDLGLLQRVEPTMVQYRKGVIDHKWIKHRNHTYYDLTDKGRKYLNYSDNR